MIILSVEGRISLFSRKVYAMLMRWSVALTIKEAFPAGTICKQSEAKPLCSWWS